MELCDYLLFRVFSHEYEHAGFLLEIVSVGPFIGCFLREETFKLDHCIVLVEEVFHVCVEIGLAEFSKFGPDKPFVAVGPFKELHREIFCLLIFVVRDVV